LPTKAQGVKMPNKQRVEQSECAASVQLKPCPFCGEMPSQSYRLDESLWSHAMVTWYRVYCASCDVQFESEVEGQAAEQWNTRTATTATVPIKYDPNRSISDNQLVRLKFQQWSSSRTFDVAVSGNTRGVDVIEAAIMDVYSKLSTVAVGFGNESSIAVLELFDSEGNTLELEDDEESAEDWLKEMLVSAEIISLDLGRKRRREK
jgi:Lar family restriction alleviation protein